MKTGLLHIALLLSCGIASAQGVLDSILRIDTVEVVGMEIDPSYIKPIVLIPSTNSQRIDSTDKVYYQSSTLGEVLQENTGIYVKSYSPGALATSGFRGMGASQTKVFWNGIPMNSSMNGTIDLTNLPVALFEDINVSMGGASLSQSSGSLGGSISVGSGFPVFERRLKGAVLYEAGSFGKHNTGLILSGGNTKVQSKLGFVYRRAENDFVYKNTTLFGEPAQKQTSAEFEQYAGVFNLNFKPDDRFTKLRNSHYFLNAFFSKTARNIPPTMLSANTFQSQYDWLGMVKLGWSANAGGNAFNADVTYKYDDIHFTSELPVIDSKNKTHTVFGQLKHISLKFRKTIITSKIEHTSQWAIANNFNGLKYQPITALVLNPEYRYKDNKLITSLILRQELVYNSLSPFLPSLSIRYAPLKRPDFYLSTNIFRNYRYPTLNDRYWSIGGNTDLQQEKGWGTEGKVGYDKSYKKGVKLETSINAYYLDVQNWILWLPESSTGIWTPENVKRVKSRGVEALIKVDGKKNDWTYRFTGNYHFNKATNETSGGAIGSSEGKLLIYTPQHLGNISGMVGYKGYYIQYRQHLCGKRYITSDNGQSLPAFTTGDLRIGKDFGKKLKGLSLYLAAENLWNAQYQNIAWRPMPGRNFSGGVRYEFAVKKK